GAHVDPGSGEIGAAQHPPTLLTVDTRHVDGAAGLEELRLAVAMFVRVDPFPIRTAVTRAPRAVVSARGLRDGEPRGPRRRGIAGVDEEHVPRPAGVQPGR